MCRNVFADLAEKRSFILALLHSDVAAKSPWLDSRISPRRARQNCGASRIALVGSFGLAKMFANVISSTTPTGCGTRNWQRCASDVKDSAQRGGPLNRLLISAKADPRDHYFCRASTDRRLQSKAGLRDTNYVLSRIVDCARAAAPAPFARMPIDELAQPSPAVDRQHRQRCAVGRGLHRIRAGQEVARASSVPDGATRTVDCSETLRTVMSKTLVSRQQRR